MPKEGHPLGDPPSLSNTSKRSQKQASGCRFLSYSTLSCSLIVVSAKGRNSSIEASRARTLL